MSEVLELQDILAMQKILDESHVPVDDRCLTFWGVDDISYTVEYKDLYKYKGIMPAFMINALFKEFSDDGS